jgi:hypothetical protein
VAGIVLLAGVAFAGGPSSPRGTDAAREIHGDLVVALEEANERVARARASGSREILAAALRHLADIHFVRDEKVKAAAVRAEARELSRGTGPPPPQP